MMEHADVRGRLDDFFDGALPPAEREAVAEHLGGCEECRAGVEAMAELRERTRALPREVAPRRDLWPEIAARLRERGAAPAEARPRVIEVEFRAPARRPLRQRWAPLAAAAVVLVALSSGVTAFLITARGTAPVAVSPAPAPSVAARPTSALAAFRPTEVEYLGTVEALEADLAARRDRLAPQTVAVIEENLRIIDGAIAEARAALEADPANADLPLLLSGVYRKKVELLQSALQLPARSL